MTNDVNNIFDTIGKLAGIHDTYNPGIFPAHDVISRGLIT